SAPPTQPQVVGAAAVREKGTRPMPTTPAAKAAALTQEATRAASGSGTDEPDAGGDGVTLAEEGPRSHGGTVLRLLALIVVSAVVLAGGSYAAYAWSQQQYHLSGNDGVVTVYQGVNQTLGPISLSRPLYTTTIAVDDLPPSYQSSLEQGIDVDDRAAADARVEDLRLQATACRWARLNGEECRTVPSTWTPPSPTPTLTPTPSPSGTPSGTTPAPTPTTTSRGPSPTGSPVTA
ncbi:MAG TPA: serine/threonine-protein phosphatase, partial [Ornithinibacter sp.]|nr:serine/threonine-protein phosphatase [Ornithinibacter sp.]